MEIRTVRSARLRGSPTAARWRLAEERSRVCQLVAGERVHGGVWHRQHRGEQCDQYEAIPCARALLRGLYRSAAHAAMLSIRDYAQVYGRVSIHRRLCQTQSAQSRRTQL